MARKQWEHTFDFVRFLKKWFVFLREKYFFTRTNCSTPTHQTRFYICTVAKKINCPRFFNDFVEKVFIFYRLRYLLNCCSFVDQTKKSDGDGDDDDEKMETFQFLIICVLFLSCKLMENHVTYSLYFWTNNHNSNHTKLTVIISFCYLSRHSFRKKKHFRYVYFLNSF